MSAVRTALATGDASFRRDAAHALSTPLGSLLLQAELIDYFLQQDKPGKAQQAAASLMNDCEGFARLLRSVFGAMADMAEDGDERGNPGVCLSAALAELGDETVAIDYRGPSPTVNLPGIALRVIMRRIAIEATTLGAEDAVMTAVEEGDTLRLSLTARRAGKPALQRNPFEGDHGLNLWTVREIAARHEASLLLDDDSPDILGLVLPLHRTVLPQAVLGR